MDPSSLIAILFGGWLMMSMYKDLMSMRKTVAENIDSHPHKRTLKIANNIVTVVYLFFIVLIFVGIILIIKNLF
jgi:uncharacterized membrane protein YkgB